MSKSIIVLIRALVYMVAVSPLVALSVSMLSSSPAGSLGFLGRRWDVVCELGSPNPSRERCRFYLLDQLSGEATTLRLPEEEHWGMVGVSPWSDAQGNAEAVGHCYSNATAGDGGAFWGLARLQLPEGKLIDRFRLDLLPTSRPCWIPGLPGAILFAAGDGRLYRFDFSDQTAVEDLSASESGDHDSPRVPRAVAWDSPPRHKGAMFLTDPVWPGHPAFPRIAFASLIAAPHSSEPGAKSFHRLWWLKMNKGGSVIEASGPLVDHALEAENDESSVKRFPDLAVGPDGSLHLIYLRHINATSARLEALPIETDPPTGVPRVVAGARPSILATDCTLAPPVVSADRRAVYGISKTLGRVVRHTIGSQTELATR